MTKTKLIPVTIVTGFLGSGKTTLLNRILKENHGQKIAVVLNEIGDVNLDSELVVQSLGEELKIMNNGCVCCTVRGDLTKICLDLVNKKLDFTHIVIETTGMADPSPVAQTFFMEKALSDRFYLDAILTVVDAKYIEQNLKEIKETQDQIGFADVIVLNKIDAISSEEVKQVEQKIKSINSLARIIKTSYSEVPINEVFGIEAFNLEKRAELNPEIKQVYHDHSHDNSIESVYLEQNAPLDSERLEKFMQILFAELGNQLLRYKGVISVKDQDKRIIFQGVHTSMTSAEDRNWEPGEERKTRMVFIGRHLPKDVLKEGLALCAAK